MENRRPENTLTTEVSCNKKSHFLGKSV